MQITCLTCLFIWKKHHALKAHRQISKKRCFEKYCWYDQACQFSALQGIPWRSYLENLTIDDKSINKRARLFTHQKMYGEEKITSTSNKVAKYFWSSHRSRTSHRRCSVKKGVLKNFASFTGKHLYWSLFYEVTGLQPANFLKKRLQHKCFSVEFAKLLRTPILMNICKRLLLEVFYKAVLKNFAIFTGRR